MSDVSCSRRLEICSAFLPSFCERLSTTHDGTFPSVVASVSGGGGGGGASLRRRRERDILERVFFSNLEIETDGRGGVAGCTELRNRLAPPGSDPYDNSRECTAPGPAPGRGRTVQY
jgi:hypothetical protein